MAVLTDPDDLSQGGETSVASTTFASASGAQIVITSANVPAVTAGDYIEVRDATNAANDGLYLVDSTVASTSITATKQALVGSVTNPANDASSQSIRIFGTNADEKNIYFDTTNRYFTLINGFQSGRTGNTGTALSDDGVTIQCLYSFMKDSWKTDNDLIKFPFPMTAITPEQFEFNEWKPVDEADTGNTVDTTPDSNTRNLFRTGGWSEVDANSFIEKLYFCWLTLGNIDSTNKLTGDRPYYFFSSQAAATSAVFAGPANEGVEAVTRVDLTGAGTLAFVDGGGGNDSFTRTTGSFVTDGFLVGDYLFIQNAEDDANDGSYEILSVAATTLEVATASFTANADDTTVIAAIDRRPLEFTTRIRVFGKTYDQSTFTAIGVTTATNQVYRFPLSEATDNVISDLGVSEANAGGAAAPYDDMTIAYFSTGQSRSGFTEVMGDGGTTNFSVIIDGDVSEAQQDGGGAATAEQIYAFVQAALAKATDINDGAGAAAVTVIGQLAEPLLSIASTGNTLQSIALTDGTNPGGSTGEGVYVDSFASADKNRVSFIDDDGDNRTFPLTVVLTLNFNANITGDNDAIYKMFFTNDDAGDNTGRDFGTIDAIVVQDDTNTDISGGPGSIPSQVTKNYAYDLNQQRGAASTSTDAPVTIVAIGLSTAQYVVATGTITNTGLTASLVAALERNFSDPV